MDMDQIADAAGRINAAVTRSVYRHVLADKLATAARVMDSTFRSAGGASMRPVGSQLWLPDVAHDAMTRRAARATPWSGDTAP